MQVKHRNEEGVIIDQDAINNQYKDQRLAAHFVYYPQPFGFQVEYNVGSGPEYLFSPSHPISEHSIGVENLHGGYAKLMYMIRTEKQIITPFTRFMMYKGAKKFELDARKYDMKELEIGAEWQINSAFEFTANYTIADRRYEDSLAPINRQKGQLIRLQVQINY